MNTIPLTRHDKMPQSYPETAVVPPDTGRHPCYAVSAQWYVVEADARKHTTAVGALSSQGYRVFFPQELVRVRPKTAAGRSGAYEWVPRPQLFGFLFVLFDADRDAWPRRDSRIGVRSLLLGPGGRPSRVDTSLVEKLIAEQDQRLTPPDRGLPPIDAGELALIVRGSFQGRVAKVIECDRHNAVVEIEAFGGRVPVRVKRVDISAE